jgi:hypothetical protein
MPWQAFPLRRKSYLISGPRPKQMAKFIQGIGAISAKLVLSLLRMWLPLGRRDKRRNWPNWPSAIIDKISLLELLPSHPAPQRSLNPAGKRSRYPQRLPCSITALAQVREILHGSATVIQGAMSRW